MKTKLAVPPSLETESKGTRRIGLVAFLFLFILLGGWFWSAQIEGAVIASGNVGVTGKPKTIQHYDGGVVADILINNGDMISSGDLLIRLDDTLLKSNLDIYSNRIRENSARRDRLIAERDKKQKITWDNTVFERLNILPKPEVREGQERLRLARQSTKIGQFSQLREQIEQFENQIIGLAGLRKSKNEQIRILREELVSMRGLQAEGYASDSRVLSLERQVEDLTGQLSEHDANISRVRNSISETRIQMSQIDREFDESVQTELREIELAVKDLEQQIIATQQQLSRIEIRAPVSGIVHELGIFTIGGVVGPGDGVMQIIPQTHEMEFEVNVDPQFIDQVYPGQSARVMFSAFNAQTTPELNGTVLRVSPNTIVDQQSGFTFYRVNLTIDKDELKRLGGQTLVPGMPIEVFITTEARSPLNYMIKPLTDNFRRAMREQ